MRKIKEPPMICIELPNGLRVSLSEQLPPSEFLNNVYLKALIKNSRKDLSENTQLMPNNQEQSEKFAEDME
jgi:hypothetical protein